jgi:hypothetical protein
MIFKVLVIQAANKLPVERTEYLVNDRLPSFTFWVWGSATACRTPTIWLFRERLTRVVLNGKSAIEVLHLRLC